MMLIKIAIIHLFLFEEKIYLHNNDKKSVCSSGESSSSKFRIKASRSRRESMANS